MMTPLEARPTKENAALRAENKLLREKIDLLIRRIFGKSSEQLDDGQLMLLLQGGDDGAKKAEASSASPGVLEAEIEKRGTDTAKIKPRKEREARVPEHLPAVDEVIEPEEAAAAPAAWRHIGEEITEQLDYKPAQFFRRRIIRRKYVKRDEPHQAPIIDPLNTLQERSIAAPGLLAQIIVAKYCDHLPLYRQEQIYATRHDIAIPRQSMARWIGLAADWLRPIYEHIHTGVMAGGYVQLDETPVEYLSPGNGQTKQGYLWACKRPGADVSFTWATSRAARCLDRIIPADFSGTVQCDGYAAYPSFANRSEGRITLAACWAHARRKFHEATESTPQQAGWMLLQIQHLYRIEKQLREAKAGPQQRQAVRASQSRMITERIHRALSRIKLKGRQLPLSALCKAIDYTLTMWPMLTVYLEDGRVEIDNNPVENAIRPTAIGKKNWLFIGDAEAGERSAIVFTVIEACRRRGIDPFEYLQEVFTRMPAMVAKDYPSLAPDAWVAAKQPPKSINKASHTQTRQGTSKALCVTFTHEEWELTILGLDQGMAFLLGPSSRGGTETGFVGDVGDQLGCDAAAPGQNPRS